MGDTFRRLRIPVGQVLSSPTYRALETARLAQNPGLTLFHCHQQLHMDFGFMALFDDV